MAKKTATFSNDEEIWIKLNLIAKKTDNSMAKVLKIFINQEFDRLELKLPTAKKEKIK